MGPKNWYLILFMVGTLNKKWQLIIFVVGGPYSKQEVIFHFIWDVLTLE